jgi:hypothetical protein
MVSSNAWLCYLSSQSPAEAELPMQYEKQLLPGLVMIKAEEEAILWLWSEPSIFLARSCWLGNFHL